MSNEMSRGIHPAGAAALALGASAALYGVSVVLIGNHFVNFALVPGKDGKTARMHRTDRAVAAQHDNERLEQDASSRTTLSALVAKRDAWLAEVDVEQVGIKSADDRYNLAGFIYPAARPTTAWAFLIHGYTGDHHEVELIASHYAEQGFNVFAPDLQSQGRSEGKLIGMGWTDRLDMLAWMDYLIDHFGPDIQLVMHGHSMGGATTCMVSGEHVPAQLRAAISDCAYTCVWEMFSEQVKTLFGLSPHPVLDDANLMFRLRGGYNLKKASALKQVAKSTIPLQFIHGSKDTFVPPFMVNELYEACSSPEKHLLVVEGAEHARSVITDPKLYFATVFNFLSDKIEV